MMKIIIDGFGGDFAPQKVIEGSKLALSEFDDIEIIVTGKKSVLQKQAQELRMNPNRIKFVHAVDVIEMDDDPMVIRKEKSDSSMAVGFDLLKKNEGDAFVSGGNTGALAIGATILTGRIKGVSRVALAPIMPSETGCFILLDAGANIECRPEMLLQFGIMGSIYMQKIIGIENPAVGLVNIGTEDGKGTSLQIEANKLLQDAPINFKGNIEARGIPRGECEVVVADGFTGNIILKLEEGMGGFFNDTLKSMFTKSLKSKFAAMLMMGQLKEFKKKMDYKEYGGAPFLGSAKPVIKAHGSSDEKAFFNAIRQARLFVKQNVIQEIKNNL